MTTHRDKLGFRDMPVMAAERLWWDQRVGTDDITHVGHAEAHQETVEYVAGLYRLIGPRPRVLDLGCGVGRLSEPMAEANPGGLVIGVDMSAAVIAETERARQAAGPDNLIYLVGDGRTLPDSLGPLDGAWSALMFQHCAPDVAAGYLCEVGRLLRPGSVFRFQFVPPLPPRPALALPFEYEYDPELVGRWVETAGLDVEDVALGHVHPRWAWITARKP